MKYMKWQDESGGWNVTSCGGEHSMTKQEAEAACAILNTEKPELTEEERKFLADYTLPLFYAESVCEIVDKQANWVADIIQTKTIGEMLVKAFNQVYGGLK